MTLTASQLKWRARVNQKAWPTNTSSEENNSEVTPKTVARYLACFGSQMETATDPSPEGPLLIHPDEFNSSSPSESSMRLTSTSKVVPQDGKPTPISSQVWRSTFNSPRCQSHPLTPHSQKFNEIDPYKQSGPTDGDRDRPRSEGPPLRCWS